MINITLLLNGSHTTELQKVKDVQAAAEKIRREKWIDEKTKKIKVWVNTRLIGNDWECHCTK